MGRTKSIGINAVLNVIRQCLNILFPLITYPYALRVLGAESIGKVNYSNSIYTYFSLLAMLGISSYAVREGAKIRDDRAKINSFVDEVFSINLISTIISYGLLALTLITVENLRDYKWLIILHSINILLTTLGIDYVNVIYEDYLLITLRSLFTRIVHLALLFILVKSPNDFYWYVIIQVVTNGIVCITNYFYCRKYVKLKILLDGSLRHHIKPMMILFANTIAISVYVSIDSTMLGWIKGDYFVGIYSASVNVYNIFKHLLAAIYVVSIPQLSNAFGKRDYTEYKAILSSITSAIILLLVPVCVGIIFLAPDIMYLMGGAGYQESVLSLQILGAALLFAILGGIVTACINITLGREKENLKATIIGAFLNFILNLYFIPHYSHYGAAFTTLLSEAFVMFFCLIRIPNKRQVLNLKILSINLLHSLLGVAIVVLSYALVEIFVDMYLIRMLLVFLISVILYALFLIAAKNEYAVNIMNRIQSKIKR